MFGYRVKKTKLEESMNTPVSIKQPHKAFELIVREHPQAVLLVSPENGQIVHASDRALILYGFTMNELRRMTLEDLFYSTDMSEYAERIGEERARNELGDEVEFLKQRDKFGIVHPVKLTHFKLTNEASQLSGILVCPFDSERCKLAYAEQESSEVQWFEKTDEPRKALLQNDLRKALGQGQFYLVYQPIVDVYAKRIAGYEALLRWQHPHFGEVQPKEIFDLHFPGSFLVELDCFVIAEAVKTLSHIRNDQFLHVNFSARNLKNQDYIQRLSGLLRDRTDIHNRLVLDFNESLEMLEAPVVKKLLEDNHLMFAIENFGSGVIPLAEILRSRIHTLNMDMNLIRELMTNYANAVIVNAILKIAKTMNVDAIAKGIERPEQYRYLVKNGCRYMQGFLFGRPDKLEVVSQLELALEERLEHYNRASKEETFFEEPDGKEALWMLEVDTKRIMKHIPDALVQWLGYEKRELLDKSILGIIKLEEQPKFLKEMEALKHHVYFNDLLLHLVNRHGNELYVSLSGQAAPHSPGNSLIYIEDLSYLADEGQIFIGAQNSYKTIFNESPFAIMIMNEDRECIDWNKKAELMFGWTKAEVYRKSVASIFPNVEPKMLNRILRESLSENLFVVSVNDNIKKDGGLITCRWHNKAIVDHNGQIRIIISMAEDITETLRKETAVRRLSLAMDLSESMVLMLDDKGCVTSFNEPLAAMMGWEKETVIGHHVLQFFSFGHKLPTEEIQEVTARGEIWRGEAPVMTQGGEVKMFKAAVCPVHDAYTDSNSLVIILNDLSEEKTRDMQFVEMKKLLSEQEKLATIGSMLTGIIHEINNPLSYIDTNMIALESMLSDIDYPEGTDTFEINDIIKDIKTGVQHIKAISASLKRMAFKGLHEEEEYFDINEEIETVLNVAKNEYKYYAFVEFDKTPDLYINGLPSGIRQVMLNLLINATHAIRKRYETSMGSIKVSSARVGDMIEIRVTDNGTGIPEAIRGDIFETFFTTKKKGEGTGLGLSISKNIIEEKHHGQLTFESEEGVGTTFIILLPEAKG